jgi:xanthosine utilization system XapX-like protein
VIGPLAVAIHVLSLALAAWAFVEFLRQREPTRPLYAGLGVVGLLLLIQVVALVVRLAGGQGPATGEDQVTLVGYMLMAALLPPAGAVLARMEPTRWGTLLIGTAAVLVPVLVLRLGQIWNG